MKLTAENKIKYRKSGSNSYCSDIAIPARWLKKSGFKIPGEHKLKMEYDTESNTITIYLDI